MMKPTIPTTFLTEVGESIASAQLLVVPNPGEELQIADKLYTVRKRKFVLVQMYNAGQPYGFSQSCMLTLREVKYKEPGTELNC